MLAVLVRTLCGVVVLVSLVGEHPSAARIHPEPVYIHQTVTQPSANSIPVAMIEPEKEVEYQPELLYRVHRVTAYCDRGLTAAGVSVGVGQCAAPADIPFGSRIYIPSLDRTFIVTDRTAKRFRHNTVDLFIPDRGDCKTFGCRYVECEIAIPTDTVRYGSPRLRALFATAHRL